MILRRHKTSCSDADLASLISNGDETAFRILLERHQDAVYRFARRFLQHDQEAEDATQETFLRFFRTSSRFQPTASLRTFLLRIAKNICIDLVRRKSPELMDRLPEVIADKTPLDLLENAIEADHLEKAIQNLPVNQRTALLFRHGEHLKYCQIADIMELSISAVESLLVRARRNLQQELSGRK